MSKKFQKVDRRKNKGRRQEDNRMNQQAREEGQLPKFKKAPPLTPMNQLQAEYIHAIHSHPYVFATGHAGTSKTYIPTRIAAQLLQQGEVERIIIARPAASMSESLGFFKGDAIEKMRMWIAPVLDALQEEFPPSTIDYFLEHGKILPVPMETIKGRSFKDAFIIVDEAIDCTFKEIVALMTRLGTNSTMVFAGDLAQCDLKSESGVAALLRMKDSNPRLNNSIDHIDFNDYDEIVRSDAVKNIIIGLDEARKQLDQPTMLRTAN